MTVRRVASVGAATNALHLEPKPGEEASNECDTNADTCCLGKNFIILEPTRRTADVYAYDKSIKPIEGVPIVNGATAWDDPITGQTLILVINEALYYGTKLEHTLINPNQVRSFGIDFWDNPFDKERGLIIDIDDTTKIPMQTNGTKIFFNTRAPTLDELRDCAKVHLTSKQEWNPTEVSMKQTTSIKAITKYTPSFRISEMTMSINETAFEYVDPKDDDALLHSIDPSLTDLKEQLMAKVPRNIAQVTRYEDSLEDLPTRQTYTSTERHSKISAEVLADRFGIGIERARATLRATLQRGVRSATLPIGRRYRADRQYGVKRLAGKFATDTLWAKSKSLNQNVASQIYSHKCGFNAVYHMAAANNENVGYSLNDVVNDYGAFEHLTYDGAAVQVGRNTLFQKSLRKYYIKSHVSAPRRPNENPAEAAIREVKKRWYRMQAKKNIPDRLWDFGISYVCETGNLTVNSSRYSNGRPPLEIITGETQDVSEYLDFGFYDWVLFRTNAGLGLPEIGRWLGVSHRVGQLMSYWILPESGIPISCTTVQRLTNLEKQTDEYKKRMTNFDTKLETKWTTTSSDISDTIHDKPNLNVLSLEREDEEFVNEYKRVIDSKDVADIEDYTNEEVGIKDPYINMELGITRDEEGMHHARVKRRAVDEEGKPIGMPSDNPLMDQRQYEIEYMDGRTEILTANIIAENLLAQVDDDGHRHLLIDEIEDHRILEDAIPKEQGTFVTNTGRTRKKRTTRGWELYVRWKDGSGDWVALKDLKDSYPVPLADYAVANKIEDEPAFAWWVPFTLKKRISIISKIKSKYWQKTHKYGLRIPKNVDEAKTIDKENGNTMWMDSVKLEMKNNRVAFETYEGNTDDLVGYQEITGHIIFDVKLAENFRRKARFVADGHKCETPSFLTYSTVVSRDSVRIILMAAALNGLEIKGADIQNAFLSAPNLEKHWIRAGTEFGAEQGKTFIVVRALYGLKSASAAFRSFMAKRLDAIGFKSCVADPDVWLRPAVKDDGSEYYEYILMYVDDILAISMDSTKILKSIEGDTVRYKNDKIESPEMYLGAKLQQKELNGINCWTITSVDYINAAIKTIEEGNKNKKWKLPPKPKTPMSQSYSPELDCSPELDDDDLQYFQELIGMLRWATELGRVDVLHETSLLSQYLASPREGHLEQALQIFAFLKGKPKLTLYMDPSLPNIDYQDFTAKPEEFKEYYRDAEEEMPHRMPRPRGIPVVTTSFVDSSHAANKVTRKSHSGHIIFVNRAPVKWLSRRQQTVEISAFSSEFIALKHCLEDIEHLRFKLRMFGIPISEERYSTNIFCDNASVVKNTTNVDSTLNKKHSAVAYNFIRWNVAAGVCSLAWISTHENLADAMTKRLSAVTREYLFGNWTY